MVVDPHDPDRDEADRVGGVLLPDVQELSAERVVELLGEPDVDDQQRGGDREDAVREGLEATRGHAPAFAAVAAHPRHGLSCDIGMQEILGSGAVILLPVFGLVAGLVIGRREALLVTAFAAVIGFTLVAVLTDEISGWSDGFVWGDTIVALLATLLGIAARRWYRSRRMPRERST